MDLRASIQLHRRIDALTDRHPLVRQICGQFVQGKRRYAGILLDVLWDHALARNWDDYSKESLHDFCYRISAEVAADGEAYGYAGATAPPAARLANVLLGYQRPASIDRALAQIASRLRQPQPFTPLIHAWRSLVPDLEPVHPVLLRDILQQLQVDWPAILADQSQEKGSSASLNPA